MAFGGGDVDAADAGAGVDAAGECGVKRKGKRNVIDERALALEELRVDVSLDTRAESPGRHLRLRQVLPSSSAARRTAAMMLAYPVQRQRLPDSR